MKPCPSNGNIENTGFFLFCTMFLCVVGRKLIIICTGDDYRIKLAALRLMNCFDRNFVEFGDQQIHLAAR